MEALARVSPVPIRYEGMEGDRKVYFIDLNHPIAIKEGMGEAQTAKTGGRLCKEVQWSWICTECLRPKAKKRLPAYSAYHRYDSGRFGDW